MFYCFHDCPFSFRQRDLDVASGNGGSVNGIRVRDADFRVQDALEVVVGVVRLEFDLVDGLTVFVGQVAQVGAFTNVETKLEGLALESELLEGVCATVCRGWGVGGGV